jgi:hypothetical protein
VSGPAPVNAKVFAEVAAFVAAAVAAFVVVVVAPPAAVVVVVPDPGVGAGTKAIGTDTLGSVALESPNESVQVSPAACCAAVGGQG